jgi:hypothetical protein
VCLSASILAYQLLIPPIVGLADQGDFVRVIGRFGYSQAPTAPSGKYEYVPARFQPGGLRVPEWEQPSSESLFVAAALVLNKVVSKDGGFSIQTLGVVHTVAFLLIYARLLRATRLRGCLLLWIGATLILTDVGYVAYWNSLYREPASGLFCLLLIAESILLCRSGTVSTKAIVRWIVWAVLLVLAKEQNTALAVLLAIFLLRLQSWKSCNSARWAAVGGLAVVLGAGAFNLVTSPAPEHRAAAYNMLFLAIAPESNNPAADLADFGLSSRATRFAGTNAWSPNTGFSDPEVQAALNGRLTMIRTAGFFLARPGRLWRHVTTLLPRSTGLRPEFCGNFQASAGLAPGTRSHAFALWSGVHEWILPLVSRVFLFLLLLPLLAVICLRGRDASVRCRLDLAALLSGCCLASFFAAAFGDALDNVKHMYLFNLLLDTCLLWSAVALVERIRKRPVEWRSAGATARSTSAPRQTAALWVGTIPPTSER